jgi:hypothetical protein
VPTRPAHGDSAQDQALFQADPDTIEKKTGQTPRKVVAGYFLSLDGVAEAPDRFITAWDDETDASGANLIASQDAVILGRRSHDEWAEFWPGSEIQPFAPLGRYLLPTSSTSSGSSSRRRSPGAGNACFTGGRPSGSRRSAALPHLVATFSSTTAWSARRPSSTEIPTSWSTLIGIGRR